MDQIQEKIETDKNIINYDEAEIKYLVKPLGKALYKKDSSKQKCSPSGKKWNDRIMCELCKKEYTRSCKSAHEKTKLHQAYVKINKKLQKILINE